MNKIKNYLSLILAGIFIIAIFFFPIVLYFSGFFVMAILLSCLKKREPHKVLIILSPIITYPLFLYIVIVSSIILNLPFHWLQNLIIYIAIYALLYGLVFKNLWSWLAVNKRKFSILALTLVAAITLFHGSLAAECYVTSTAEKGVSREDVSKCRLFNLYLPDRSSGSFSSLTYAMIKIPAQGVGFTSIVVVLTLIFFEVKHYHKSGKSTQA